MSANQNIGGTIVQDMVLTQNVGGTIVEPNEGWQNINGTLVKIYVNPNKSGWWAKNGFTEDLFSSLLFSSYKNTTLTSIECTIDGNKLSLKIDGKSGDSRSVSAQPNNPYCTDYITVYDYYWYYKLTMDSIKYPGACITTAADKCITVLDNMSGYGYVTKAGNIFQYTIENIASASGLIGDDGAFKGAYMNEKQTTIGAYSKYYSDREGNLYYSGYNSSTATLLDATIEMREAHYLYKADNVVTVPMDETIASDDSSCKTKFTINKTLNCCFGGYVNNSGSGSSGYVGITIEDSNGETVCSSRGLHYSVTNGSTDTVGIPSIIKLAPGEYTVFLSVSGNTGTIFNAKSSSGTLEHFIGYEDE